MFNFFKNFLKFSNTNKNTANSLLAVSTGEIIPLENVPDIAFSSKLVGDGVAILPTDNIILAPASGILSLVFKTKHAFAITLSNGLEILVHIGIDTVTLNGEGFQQLVQEGEWVEAGTPIIKINRDLIIEKGFSLITPILITNIDITSNISALDKGNVISGETPVVEYTLK